MALRLTPYERACLSGQYGEAAEFAMTMMVRLAEALDAEELLPIEQAHIDACALMAPSNLDFVEHLLRDGGRFAVPTTLSMISLDLEHWKVQAVPKEFAEQALRIADGYLKLGGIPVWTCAPYQDAFTPRFGQQIAWGESNAVVYANSVLGARTERYADYLDVCAAITGRVPHGGLHIRGNRRGRILVRLQEVPNETWRNPAAWAALGHWLGTHAGSEIPVVDGLPAAPPSAALKALGAAAASSGGIALFHAVGITPEAPDLRAAFHGEIPADAPTLTLEAQDLAAAWEDLGTIPSGDPLDAVILGCPHASYEELRQLAEIAQAIDSPRVHPNVQMLVFTHSTSYHLALRQGLIEPIRRFGAQIIFDTCPFHSPVLRPETRTLMTNSGKCAYYAPGELNARVAFGTLEDCVRSAVAGRVSSQGAPWAT